MSVEELSELVRKGNIRAIARAITHVENKTQIGQDLISELFKINTQTQVIGITGPPGSGKSTLVDQLIKQFRIQDMRIAVLAVDPSSPFSGGALLGDRIRMLQFSDDQDVYIRSMASRGKLGGLTATTFDVIALLKAARYDKIIVETVGAGQSEVDIVQHADTTLVLVVPGLGDDIQMIKAGIMEIADIFVVNKSDLPSANQLSLQIKKMLETDPSPTEWLAPIVNTSAQEGSGITELTETMANHWNFLSQENKLLTLRRSQLKFNLLTKIRSTIVSELLTSEVLENVLDRIIKEELSLKAAITNLLDHVKYHHRNKEQS